MSLNRLLRRCHAPLACLCIASIFSLGCAARHSTWGIEEVAIPLPIHTLVAEDGSLVLGFHVQREQDPADSGWHWMTVSPDTSAVLLGQTPRDADDNLDYPVAVGWGKDWSDTQIHPPLLEPGLPDQPPAGFGGFDSGWRVVAAERQGVFEMACASDPACLGPEFVFLPGFERDKTAGRSFSEGATGVVTLPLLLASAAVTVVVWTVTQVPKELF